MSDLLPERRIDRGAVERIIRRAAELQASGHDIADSLTEDELLQLGKEVGIPSTYLQQALFEEETRALVQGDRGLATWLAGPRRVVAERVVPGEMETLRTALNQWMTEGELLTVKRRYPDYASWEQRRDVLSSLKRGFKVGGHDYVLATAKEIVGRVVPVDDVRCDVCLVADLSNTRQKHLGGGVTMFGVGGITSFVGVTLGVAVPVALLPLAIGGVTGFAIARHRRSELERVQVALEQVLDRLEHGEIRVNRQISGPRFSAFGRIAEEIRRNLGV